MAKNTLLIGVVVVILIVVVAGAMMMTREAPQQPTQTQQSPTQTQTQTQTQAPPAEAKEYKMSIVVGPQSPWGQAAKMWADEVERLTNGKVKKKIYYAGQLFAGKQTNEFQLLSQGVADFAIGSTINWSPVIKELNLFTLPFFFPEGSKKGDIYRAVDAITGGEAGKKIFQI